MELLLHQWGDWPELYRNTDKTEATEIVIIDSQMNYRGKLDTYLGLRGNFSSGLSYDAFISRSLYKPEGYHTKKWVPGFTVSWKF